MARIEVHADRMVIRLTAAEKAVEAYGKVAADAVELLVREGLVATQNRFNS